MSHMVQKGGLWTFGEAAAMNVTGIPTVAWSRPSAAHVADDGDWSPPPLSSYSLAAIQSCTVAPNASGSSRNG